MIFNISAPHDTCITPCTDRMPIYKRGLGTNNLLCSLEQHLNDIGIGHMVSTGSSPME